MAVLRVRGEMAEFYGKKADNPHRGRRQGDPCDLRQPRHVFANAGSSSTSLSRWTTPIRRARNASGTAVRGGR